MIDCCNTYAGPGVADPCAFSRICGSLSKSWRCLGSKEKNDIVEPMKGGEGIGAVNFVDTGKGCRDATATARSIISILNLFFRPVPLRMDKEIKVHIKIHTYRTKGV